MAGLGFGRNKLKDYVNSHKIATVAAEQLGPELSPGFGNFGLTGSPAPTQDANGIYFDAAANSSTAGKSVAALEDDANYKVVITVSGYVSGAFDIQIYGNTTAHLAQSQTINANGTYTIYLLTDAGAGSLVDTMRIRATGASGTNTFNITAFSVKKVL